MIQYYLLEPGDKIQPGDEYWNDYAHKWQPRMTFAPLDQSVVDRGYPVRRAVPAQATPPEMDRCGCILLPGEGYYLIQDGTIIGKYDEVWENGTGPWGPLPKAIGKPYTKDLPFRTFHHWPIRRPQWVDRIPEGYRVLEIGERCVEGDKFWSCSTDKWWLVSEISIGNLIEKRHFGSIIRAIYKPVVYST